MWYKCWAGWGSIKSQWCIGLFLSLSFSLSCVREEDRRRREMKTLQEGEKPRNPVAGAELVFLGFFSSSFFFLGCIIGISWAWIIYLPMCHCLCVSTCNAESASCTWSGHVYRRAFNKRGHVECDVKRLFTTCVVVGGFIKSLELSVFQQQLSLSQNCVSHCGFYIVQCIHNK